MIAECRPSPAWLGAGDDDCGDKQALVLRRSERASQAADLLFRQGSLCPVGAFVSGDVTDAVRLPLPFLIFEGGMRLIARSA